MVRRCVNHSGGSESGRPLPSSVDRRAPPPGLRLLLQHLLQRLGLGDDGELNRPHAHLEERAGLAGDPEQEIRRVRHATGIRERQRLLDDRDAHAATLRPG